MKSENSKPLVFLSGTYFIALAAFVFYLVFFTDLYDFMDLEKNTSDRNYATGWTLDSGEIVDITEISPGDLGGSFVASKRLPALMEESDSLYFSTSNLKFDVYVDNKLIYSYDTEENLTGVGDGVSYHMVGLSFKDSSKTVRIEGASVFSDGRGGHINDMHYGMEEQYRHYKIRTNIVDMSFSLLMIIFGFVVVAFYFGMSKKNPMMRSLWALGLSAIIFGLWSLCDIGISQMLTGVTYASRDIVYGILHLAGFPMVYFVYYITKSRKEFYLYLSFAATIVCTGCIMVTRFALEKDFHNIVLMIYLSYVCQLILILAELADNLIYCRKNKVPTRLGRFYIGALIFVVTSFIDMFRYVAGVQGSLYHGSYFRIGTVLFFIFMAFQIFEWWSSEKTSLERDRFINRMLHFAIGSDDPEVKINKLLEYMCKELDADRAYIFEDMHDGTFDNTYEYCAEGVTAEIDNLKGLPFVGVVDSWYHEYEKGGHILIYDIEKYKEESLNMYNVLKPQGINTLVTGPLILDGKYIGFFGVDNPPVNMMKEVSEMIRLIMFFLSEMVSQRDSHKLLIDYSFHDSLTGAGNRRSIKEFENGELDTSRSYGFVMCDINGLKITNDSEGHDAGDVKIKETASALFDIFGTQNVYRMGGDEFAVYIYVDSEKELADKVQMVRDIIEPKNVSVSIGYSFAKAGDADYSSHRTIADNLMYEEKRKHYRNNNDRRKSEA